MSTHQQTSPYSLLPAHRFANRNFRGLFLALAVIETLVTLGSTTTCFVLSLSIYTRRPFLLLHHSTFHPYIQASFLLLAAVSQLFKCAFLASVIVTVFYCDGEIFLANAQVQVEPKREMDQRQDSPNDIARRCFQRRQRAIRWLRKVLGIYPVLQLLCGGVTLIFWWKGGAGAMNTPYYQRIIQRASGPCKALFSLYLTCWSVDLLLTPLLLLVTILHYARVDWNVQLLTAQGGGGGGGGGEVGEEGSDDNTPSVSRFREVPWRRRGRRLQRRRKGGSKSGSGVESSPPRSSRASMISFLQKTKPESVLIKAHSPKRLSRLTSFSSSSSSSSSRRNEKGLLGLTGRRICQRDKRGLMHGHQTFFLPKADPVSVPVSPSSYCSSSFSLSSSPPYSLSTNCVPSSPPPSRPLPPLPLPPPSSTSSHSRSRPRCPSTVSSCSVSTVSKEEFSITSAGKACVTVVPVDDPRRLRKALIKKAEKTAISVCPRRASGSSVQSVHTHVEVEHEQVGPITTTSSKWHDGDGFDCFRICIHTDDISPSPTGLLR